MARKYSINNIRNARTKNLQITSDSANSTKTTPFTNEQREERKRQIKELLDLSQSSIDLEASIDEDQKSKLSVIDKIRKQAELHIQNNKTDHKWDNLLSIVSDPAVLHQAYANIRSNKGSTTPGTAGESSDGFSMTKLYKLSNELKDGTYTPSPVLQVMIPKPGKTTKRPLGIPDFKDKVAAEALRLVLDAIYEPEFEKVNANHGFRAHKSPHSALDSLEFKIQGLNLAIEGDIESAYPSMAHVKLIRFVKEKIKCKHTVRLIWSFLRAGIFNTESLKMERSLSGVPQGQLISPLLFNVYMHKFDLFIQGELTEYINEKYNTNRSQNAVEKPCKAYSTINNNIYRARKRRAELIESVNLPYSKWPEDKTKLRLQLEDQIKQKNNDRLKVSSNDKAKQRIRTYYIRYADDWVLFINSSQLIAADIKDKIAQWLVTNLSFKLSPSKTKITELVQNPVLFLGFAIGSYAQKALSRNTNALQNQDVPTSTATRGGHGLFINPDWNRILSRMRENRYCEFVNENHPYPREKAGYAKLNVDTLFNKYNAIMRGLLNYYYPIITTPSQLQLIEYIMTYSFLKTLAHKYKTTLGKLIGQSKGGVHPYTKKATIGGTEKEFQLLTLRDYIADQETKVIPKLLDDEVFSTYKVNWRTKKCLTMGSCALCGDPSNLEMHHIRSIRSLKTEQQLKERKGRKPNKSVLFNFLREMNRKQVPLCRMHHQEVTAGTLSIGSQMSLLEIYEYRMSQLIK